jgi:hypothetical protein
MEAEQRQGQQAATTSEPFEWAVGKRESAEMAVLRMEHDSVIAAAKTCERDSERIAAEIERRARICPEAAATWMYAKCVGSVGVVECTCGNRYEVNVKWNGQAKRKEPERVTCEQCSKWAPNGQVRVVKKYARDLSIRAAEEAREVYGFNKIRCTVSVVDATKIKVGAEFFDYVKMNTWSTESIVSKVAKSRMGGTYEVDDSRFYDQMVKAEKSKCIREAILRSMPAFLKVKMRVIAERIAESKLNQGELDSAIAFFADKGITLSQLEHYIGRTRDEGWTKEDKLNLWTAWKQIEADEATVADVFGAADDTPRGLDDSARDKARADAEEAKAKRAATPAKTAPPKQPEPKPSDEGPFPVIGGSPVPEEMTAAEKIVADLHEQIEAAETVDAVSAVMARADAAGLGKEDCRVLGNAANARIKVLAPNGVKQQRKLA